MSLRIVRSCTAAETAELARYLAGTDVSGYGSLLRAGDAIASLVELVGRAELGRTWSIFGNLGGIEAPTAAGRLKFLVAEVRAILNRPDCTDVRSRDRLESIIAAERARELHDRRITLARTTAGPIVVDGNKRAAALHELAPADVVVPAFLIESSRSRPPLGVP